jgi:hypothetical protein
MKSIPIFHPVSMSAGEGCRYCRRRRELCGKCFLGRTTDRARLRPRIASLPARTARVVHPPFGPSNIPPLTSWLHCRSGHDQHASAKRAHFFSAQRQMPCPNSYEESDAAALRESGDESLGPMGASQEIRYGLRHFLQQNRRSTGLLQFAD